MASTRRPEIYQDPASSPNTEDMPPHSSHHFLGLTSSDENSQHGFSPSHDIIFNPPVSNACGRSPLKAVRQASASPPKANFGNQVNVSLPPPQISAFMTDSPMKRPTTSMYPPIAPHKPLKAIFTTFPSTGSADKENATPSYHSDNFAEFPDPSPGYKAPLKRTLSTLAPSQDRKSKRARVEQPSAPKLPDPEMMPLLDDDGKKPNYSYAVLIGMAILRAPDRRLTLAQIYKWISDTFSWYNIAETGWQNSIRHNLSLNKAFVKQERPKDDPGKGNYWAIEPGYESQFINKDKSSRRPTSSSGPIMKSSSQQLSSDANAWPPQLPAAPKPVPRISEVIEPSSDATIPASDAPSSPADEVEGVPSMPPPASRFPNSSPLQAINSSPPIAHHSDLPDGTPSPVVDFPGQSWSKKRKLAEMDDSGYFSSLGSSATRPYPNPMLPQRDPNKHRIKRGRAEEEIARMRSSSHDISPSKGRSLLKQQQTPSLVSSSPVRHFDTSLMLPPLTPNIKFKLPQKPPASISPNTNLRNHRDKIRELVGSPIKNSLLNDEVSFSPAFNIVDDEHYMFNDNFPTGFNIFSDSNENEYRRVASASPEKRSARRARIDRASKTANVLADVTGTSLNSKSSLLQVPAFESPLKQKSSKTPLRFGIGIDDSSKEDLFDLAFLEDDEPDDFGGLDILQGFQKIGGNRPPAVPAKKAARPALNARSHTSRF